MLFPVRSRTNTTPGAGPTRKCGESSLPLILLRVVKVSGSKPVFAAGVDTARESALGRRFSLPRAATRLFRNIRATDPRLFNPPTSVSWGQSAHGPMMCCSICQGCRNTRSASVHRMSSHRSSRPAYLSFGVVNGDPTPDFRDLAVAQGAPLPRRRRHTRRIGLHRRWTW